VRRGLAVLACAGVLACSHDEDDKPRQLDLTPGFARASAASADGKLRPASPARPIRPEDPRRADVDSSVPPLQMIVTHTVVIESGAPAPRVNPDDAILERARVAAGGCFGSLPTGPASPRERNAHIVFTVIPTGTVTNADVSSEDTGDEAVLACLRQQALGTRFSDNAGGPLRSYAIDVRVIAK
jgi:hypothetical protein